MHGRCFLDFNVSFHLLKLLNTPVVLVDLQRFCPEFRAFQFPFDNVTNVGHKNNSL